MNIVSKLNSLHLPASIIRRHLIVLLIVTLLVQGVMYISYPLGNSNYDDNQAAHLYYMDQLRR